MRPDAPHGLHRRRERGDGIMALPVRPEVRIAELHEQKRRAMLAGMSTATDIDQEFLAAFAERWEAAWNSHEPDRVLELMTEDVVYDDDAWPRTMRGHADVREFLESVWRAMPDLEFRMVEGPFVREGAPVATFHWEGSGTFTGPLDPPGFAPNGARMEIDGFDLQEYRDGKVCRLRIVTDMLGASRQLGLMPPQGSGVEKAMVTAQRLAMQVRDRVRSRG
jgi:steroid delta-isomerase-like uncharacterized protein